MNIPTVQKTCVLHFIISILYLYVECKQDTISCTGMHKVPVGHVSVSDGCRIDFF